MPAHNESENLRWLLPHVNDVLPALFERYNVIIVDDGSTDGTGDVARKMAADLGIELKVVRHEHKSGYGAAVGDGLREADLEYTGFTDSDGQLDVADFAKLVPLLKDGADLAAGWRMTREDPAFRSVISGTFNLLVLWTLQIDVRDVNCALKIIKTSTLKRMNLRSRSALINAEIYWKVGRLGGRYAQVAVPHHPRTMGRRSGGRLIPILRAMKELIQIRFRPGI